jgi:hypothetical protein
MKHQLNVRPPLCAAALAALVLAPAPARAQFQPRPLNDLATGESYHIEFSTALWIPTAGMSVSSEALGQTPTLIDFKQDLGLTDHNFPDLHLVLRPSAGNKFRVQLIPITYTQNGAPQRSIVFNGQRYSVNVPVSSTLQWKAYRFGYEYDFVRLNRGFGGFIVEAKYTDVQVQLQSPVANEFAHAQAPIPAIGGIGRAYVMPNIAATVEVTGFKLPDHLVKNDQAHYVDFDVYGTLNFSDNFGVQGGYRSLDVGYVIKSDTGTFTLRGPYFGGVVRY